MSAVLFAAKYSQHVSALIIEDMDIRTRPMSMNMIESPSSREETLRFNRTIQSSLSTTTTTKTAITTESDVLHAFERVGYPKEMVTRWLQDGRITKEDGGNELNSDDGVSASSGGYYYSDVNPAFRQLCYEQFFMSDHGEETWKTLAGICGGRSDSSSSAKTDIGIDTGGGGEPSSSMEGFPCHIMVAGDDGTVCDEDSIGRMKEMFGTSLNIILHRYPNATHSIHNSDQKKYLLDLKEIIRTASLA